MAKMETEVQVELTDEAREVFEKMPVQHDGWKSRKFVTAIGCLTVVESVASVAWLALNKMTAAEWVSLNQWLLPFILGLLFLTSAAEKFNILAKR